MKNRNKQIPHPQNEGDNEAEPQKAPLSFEDLLKEFTGEQSQKKQVPQIDKQTYEFEKEMPSDSEIDKVYQESIAQASYLSQELDSKKLRHDVVFEHFDEYKIKEENSFLDDLMEEMDTEDGLKKAVIYKEILDRKY